MSGLILGLCPASERLRYFVIMSLIGWAQAYNLPWMLHGISCYIGPCYSDTQLYFILGPWQNGCHFSDNIFKSIYLNENVWILIKISLTFVPKGPIYNIPALVQIMAWCRCVTRPQWVNSLWPSNTTCCLGSPSSLIQAMACNVACLAPSHYLNQCWLTVNWTIIEKNEIQKFC